MSAPPIHTKGGNIELVERFRRHNVSFLIVGGAAAIVHGCRQPDELDDLDILVEPTVENAERLIAALTESMLSIPYPPERIARPMVQMPVKHLHYYADVLTPEEGTSFADLRTRSIAAMISHVPVHVLGLTDLIAMKERVVAKAEPGSEKHERDLQCLRKKLT